jgi:hypothetical protein
MALVLHDHSLPQRPQSFGRPPRERARCPMDRSAVHQPRSSSSRAPACYVRRRLLAAGAIVVVGMAGTVAATTVQRASAAAVAPAPPGLGGPVRSAFVERTVQPGETLWGLAASLPATGDIRARVDQLAKLNHGSLLRAGDVVRIPSTWVGRR